MTSKRVEMLKATLIMLGSNADVQLEYLTKMGLPESIDELALDFDAIAAAAEDMLRHGEINPSYCECVKKLDDWLSKMSGRANAHLWTAEALRSAQEWTHVRQLANECLRLLNEAAN